MMGKTHLKIGILYYLLTAWISTVLVVPLLSPYRIEVGALGLLAASFGAIFPDADEQHSLINSRNPIFKISNKTINYINKTIKWIVGFLFFFIPAALIVRYMNFYKGYTIGLMTLSIALFIMALNNLKVGRKFPGIATIFRFLDYRFNRIKKLIMMCFYLGIGGFSIYYGYMNNQVQGYIWGLIFAVIAVLPHRTFLHAPEGLLLITLGMKYLLNSIGRPDVVGPFFIGYFSHLYLGDIFTNSGIPVSSIPIFLKKFNLHRSLNSLYKVLNKRISIPIMSTGSRLGNIIEVIYIFSLLGLTVFVYSKTIV